MVSINWCLKTKNGIEMVNPNDNMSNSYLKMAEESLEVIKKIGKNSKLWVASTSYYTMYYCLYSIMIKIGIKCEIHTCSIEFMKKHLPNLYNNKDISLIKVAFKTRNELQYYPDVLIKDNDLKIIKEGAADFLVKTKDILTKITEKEIKQIKDSLTDKKHEGKNK
ncbi:hypothetical protein K8R33_03510 [archaeon]|nr:hypothetical protein [archaeon]